MGEVIRPDPPQWEEREEIQAWRRHRERQRRPLVFNPDTGTFRPQQPPQQREISADDDVAGAPASQKPPPDPGPDGP
jgi:hypothetical protein